MATDSSKYLATLHKQIDQYFSLAEVRTLCFEMGVDYENIPGNMKSAFIRNLIVSLARKGQLQEIVDLVRIQRPHVAWENVPPDFSLPESVAQENLKQVVNHNYYGDTISVGNISGSSGVAIGRGASASVETITNAPQTTENQPATIAGANPDAQQIVKLIKMNLEFSTQADQAITSDLKNSLDIILDVSSRMPKNDLHVKLLGMGQKQLAVELKNDIPGIEDMVVKLITAVS